tara:strand:+ start:128 stop:367 length:240 start_codon:yes stop_codon:yes gene_type:complete
MQESMKKPILTLIAIFPILIFSGCSPKVTVNQMDRAYLADYLMRPDRDDLASMMYDHAYFSREASRGGKAISAGGCGCN